jgi:hypothetical protein
MKQIIDPTLFDVLKTHGRDVSRGTNCVQIGIIQSFDTAKKTAEIKLVLKRLLPDGSLMDYPPLLDVPCLTVQGGGAYLQMPITKGDTCLVLFNDRNFDGWYKTGAVSAPYDSRAHDLSDALAIIGLDSLASSQPAYPTDEARLMAGASKVSVKKDGSEASLKQGTGEVTAVGGKVRIKSASSDLKTALDSLVDALVGMTVVDPISGPLPVSASSIANLNAIKTTLAGILST